MPLTPLADEVSNHVYLAHLESLQQDNTTMVDIPFCPHDHQPSLALLESGLLVHQCAFLLLQLWDDDTLPALMEPLLYHRSERNCLLSWRACDGAHHMVQLVSKGARSL